MVNSSLKIIEFLYYKNKWKENKKKNIKYNFTALSVQTSIITLSSFLHNTERYKGDDCARVWGGFKYKSPTYTLLISLESSYAIAVQVT